MALAQFDPATSTLSVDSDRLPIVQPDTYQTFSDEFSVENSLIYFGDALRNRGVDDLIVETFIENLDYRFTDNSYVIREISDGIAQAVLDSVSFTLDYAVLTDVNVTGTYSPATYNFETDSFAAEWQINTGNLDAYLTEHGIDPIEHLLEAFASRDGFHSYVPSAIDSATTEDLLAYRYWGGLHAYFANELGDESQYSQLEEGQYAAQLAYDETVRYTIPFGDIDPVIVAALEIPTPEDLDEDVTISDFI